jgi:hypothetical protein
LVLPLFGGCSASEVVVHAKLDATHEQLMHVGAAYSRYIEKYEKPPRNVDHLRPFLKEFGDPDLLLRSPHDRERFVICWGIDLSSPLPWAKSTPVLAYEKNGVDGKRYVLTTVRSVSLMNDEDFKSSSFPPGHSPPP